MTLLETRFAPLMTAALMIGIPLALAFKAGAGVGTVLEPIAIFAGTLWEIFGGVSLILGALLLGRTLWSAWKAGEIGQKEVNG